MKKLYYQNMNTCYWLLKFLDDNYLNMPKSSFIGLDKYPDYRITSIAKKQFNVKENNRVPIVVFDAVLHQMKRIVQTNLYIGLKDSLIEMYGAEYLSVINNKNYIREGI